jgi:hypothetical protein
MAQLCDNDGTGVSTPNSADPRLALSSPFFSPVPRAAPGDDLFAPVRPRDAMGMNDSTVVVSPTSTVTLTLTASPRTLLGTASEPVQLSDVTDAHQQSSSAYSIESALVSRTSDVDGLPSIPSLWAQTTVEDHGQMSCVEADAAAVAVVGLPEDEDEDDRRSSVPLRRQLDVEWQRLAVDHIEMGGMEAEAISTTDVGAMHGTRHARTDDEFPVRAPVLAPEQYSAHPNDGLRPVETSPPSASVAVPMSLRLVPPVPIPALVWQPPRDNDSGQSRESVADASYPAPRAARESLQVPQLHPLHSEVQQHSPALSSPVTYTSDDMLHAPRTAPVMLRVPALPPSEPAPVHAFAPPQSIQLADDAFLVSPSLVEHSKLPHAAVVEEDMAVNLSRHPGWDDDDISPFQRKHHRPSSPVRVQHTPPKFFHVTTPTRSPISVAPASPASPVVKSRLSSSASASRLSLSPAKVATSSTTASRSNTPLTGVPRPSTPSSDHGAKGIHNSTTPVGRPNTAPSARPATAVTPQRGLATGSASVATKGLPPNPKRNNSITPVVAAVRPATSPSPQRPPARAGRMVRAADMTEGRTALANLTDTSLPSTPADKQAMLDRAGLTAALIAHSTSTPVRSATVATTAASAAAHRSVTVGSTHSTTMSSGSPSLADLERTCAEIESTRQQHALDRTPRRPLAAIRAEMDAMHSTSTVPMTDDASLDRALALADAVLAAVREPQLSRAYAGGVPSTMPGADSAKQVQPDLFDSTMAATSPTLSELPRTPPRRRRMTGEHDWTQRPVDWTGSRAPVTTSGEFVPPHRIDHHALSVAVDAPFEAPSVSPAPVSKPFGSFGSILSPSSVARAYLQPTSAASTLSVSPYVPILPSQVAARTHFTSSLSSSVTVESAPVVAHELEDMRTSVERIFAAIPRTPPRPTRRSASATPSPLASSKLLPPGSTPPPPAHATAFTVPSVSALPESVSLLPATPPPPPTPPPPAVMTMSARSNMSIASPPPVSSGEGAAAWWPHMSPVRPRGPATAVFSPVDPTVRCSLCCMCERERERLCCCCCCCFCCYCSLWWWRW